jgi:hypothetical protein
MIDNETINQMKQASFTERIRFIEIILQSLKSDIKPKKAPRKRKTNTFKVRPFNLGEEVHVDRDELYKERI